MDTNDTEGEEAVHLLKEWGVGSSGVRPASPDPKAHAIWKQRTMQTEKTCIRDELAKACGFGILLVKHWMSENPPNPAVRDFVTVCELCYASEITGHFLSGTVLEEWYEKDWRGMKGKAPTHSVMALHTPAYGRTANYRKPLKSGNKENPPRDSIACLTV